MSQSAALCDILCTRPILRSDVLEMKDLKPGMILKGTVRNVIDFGAFVDIGVHQDGLVHISRCRGFSGAVPGRARFSIRLRRGHAAHGRRQSPAHGGVGVGDADVTFLVLLIKHPLEAVSVGDIVEVQVLGVDEAKKRISLTMKVNQEKKG